MAAKTRHPIILSSTKLVFLALLAFTSASLPAQAECGVASTYGEGTRTATGERYNPWGITAAHRTRRLNSHVRVRNMKTGKEITVRISDRGPFVYSRILDLSLGAARALGVNGLARVCID